MSEPSIPPLEPQSALWRNISNLSGHAIVAGILIYVTTITLPELAATFREAQREQRADFLQSIEQNRADFIQSLQLERQWRDAEFLVMRKDRDELKVALLKVQERMELLARSCSTGRSERSLP
jgi:hypothetical protein